MSVISISNGQLAYRQHVMALVVSFLSLFFLDVELAEEVEGNDGIKVYNDTQQHHGKNQL